MAKKLHTMQYLVPMETPLLNLALAEARINLNRFRLEFALVKHILVSERVVVLVETH